MTPDAGKRAGAGGASRATVLGRPVVAYKRQYEEDRILDLLTIVNRVLGGVH